MLYICATPIGNMKDITIRALEILKESDIILCEDTRNSINLLNHHSIINKRLYAFHEHNENEMSVRVMDWLREGLSIVQISDAGTPGISDPGARLCNMAFANGFIPKPLPGASAYTALLSVSGLINTSSLFYGFLSNKSSQRKLQLDSFKRCEHAVTIYESTHRIVDCIKDIIDILGSNTMLVIGRELTKQFETILKITAKEYIEVLLGNSNELKGEFVITILPQQNNLNILQLTDEHIRILNLLSQELPTKKAANVASKICNVSKDLMYQYLINKNN